MKRTLLLTFLAASLLRICSFPLSENAGGDAIARAALTAQWLQHPGLQLHFHVWLPLHFWLIGATYLFLQDVELAARFLSLLTGISSVAVVAWLTKELSGLKAACLSSIVFAGYGLHIGYSVTSSCDVPYLFFTLLGLALFFYSRNIQAGWPLCFAGISLTCAAGIRYEAWIIIVALNLILLYRLYWRGFAAFAPLSAAFPAFWMIYEWRTRGNPLYAPVLNRTWVAADVHSDGTSLLYRIALPLAVVAITVTPVAIVGALQAVKQSWRERSWRIIEFATVAMVFAAVQLYQILSGGVMSFARYTLTLGAMVAVLSGIGLQRTITRPQVLAGVMSANLILLLSLSFSHTVLEDKARSISPVLRFRRYLNDTGVYLVQHTVRDQAVILDNYHDEANELASLAGFPLLPNDREFIVPDAVNRVAQMSKIEQLEPFIVKQRPVYLVYAPAGEVSSFLSFPPACSKVSLASATFDCVYHNKQYEIYRLNSPHGN